MKMIIALLTTLAISIPALAEQWLTLAERDVPIIVSASGVVSSAEVTRFGPPPSRSWRTTITQIAREGQEVKPGDVLARFDNSGADDRVRELEAELAEAEGALKSFLETSARDIEQEKLDIAAAASDAKKAALKAEQPAELIATVEYEKLVEARLMSEKKLANLKARTALSAKVRTATRQELEADIKRLNIQLQAAKDELASFTLRADRQGLIIIGTDREGTKLDVNANVNPGMVVVELVNPDELQVEVEIPEHASAKIRTGQPATVTVDAGGSELSGQVTAVANVVRRQSRSSQTMVRDVVVAFASDDLSGLRPGMSVKVMIEVDRVTRALAIPESALHYRDGYPGVRLRNGEWQAVSLGPKSENEYVVLTGLVTGQEIQL